VIVIGVLIALSAEQAVEWLHWRGQVRHGEEATRDRTDSSSLSCGIVSKYDLRSASTTWTQPKLIHL
jgi:hypothetical protein